MTTTFEVAVSHDDPAYARRAAAEALRCLDRVERRLSRFAEGSDVFRINRLAAGQETTVDIDTLDCLRIAEHARRISEGAFDVAYGSASPPSAGPRIALEEHGRSVRVLADGVQLDLGGIGKGYALDRMAERLGEWDVTAAVLSAGASTVLALDAPGGARGWPVCVGPDRKPLRLTLARRAISASGQSVKGKHIVDPRTGRAAALWRRAWSLAPTAALADALSTAFLLMPLEALRRLCDREPGAAGYLLSTDADELLSVGETG